MTQEQRSLLAGVLSMGVFFLWYFFLGGQDTLAPKSAHVRNEPQKTGVVTELGTPTFSGIPDAAPPEKTEKAYPEKRILRETQVSSIEWSSRGGVPKKIEMAGYRAGTDPKSGLMNLLADSKDEVLELVCQDCSFPLPAPNTYQLVHESPETIQFVAENAWVRVEKIYQWSQGDYLAHMQLKMINKTTQPFSGRLGLGWTMAQTGERRSGFMASLKGQENRKSFVYRAFGKIERFSEEGEAKELNGELGWAGIEDRYFLSAVIARRTSGLFRLKMEDLKEGLKMVFYGDTSQVAPGQTYEENYSYYFGPKSRDQLIRAGVGLEEAIDYGWFSVIAIPILKSLQYLYQVIHNWGLAIILLTIFIKILMNPLTIKSMKQMKEMKDLQPKLQALREKYKDDKQRLNMETMQLFRTHKVNPMGGCLPMILQMPIYIALYRVLYSAIELYHSPFFGFYRDLSAPDPYFVFPILMGISMVFQQKLTPTPSAEPIQKQMMMMMPVMFTAFMLFLPLGLVLYIFVNTLMSVIQQWMHTQDLRWRDLFRGRLQPSKE